jgi:3-oxoacyl-(acyl-carrier-protein) synthase
MTDLFVRGVGVVSPAGWGISTLRRAIQAAVPMAPKDSTRPGWQQPLQIRSVPAPPARPQFLSHARLRRTSPISHYAVAAALEALGDDATKVSAGNLRLGVIVCVMSGCVNYSRRFYDETLRDPAMASPLVFPETVFNAPASHIASLLGTGALNYTLVGDPGTFLQGLALAAQWLSDGLVDGCLVVAAEELDWLTAEAYRLFAKGLVLADGAGAVYLSRTVAPVKIAAITQTHLFHNRASQIRAASRMRAELLPDKMSQLLCDSRTGIAKVDQAEEMTWKGWPGARVSPKTLLGEGLAAAAAWQVISAIDELQQDRGFGALVSIVGCNQQAIGARFELHA